jgi:hypothetical protein
MPATKIRVVPLTVALNGLLVGTNAGKRLACSTDPDAVTTDAVMYPPPPAVWAVLITYAELALIPCIATGPNATPPTGIIVVVPYGAVHVEVLYAAHNSDVTPPLTTVHANQQ